MLREPKISVVMSAYNSERYIASSIESILAQTFKDFEFIIVNDGSTDKTSEIIETYAKKDARIIVFNKKQNTGLTNSLNVGIKMSSAEWIARLDSDDLSHPNRLRDQYEYVLDNPQVVLLGSGCFLYNEESRTRTLFKYPTSHTILKRNLLIAKKFFPHSSAFFNKRTALKVGGYREEFVNAQDWDLWLRLMQEGKVRALPLPLVTIRDHADRLSNINAGMRQFTFARTAIVLFWITKLDRNSRAGINQLDLQFDVLYSQVEELIRGEKYYSFEKTFMNLRKGHQASKRNSRLRTLYDITIKDPKIAFHLIHRQLFGESFLRRKARSIKASLGIY